MLVYMTRHKRTVQLTRKEIEQLKRITRSGKHGSRIVNRARILLRSHEGEGKDAIAERLSIGRSTIQRIRDRYNSEGLDHALQENPRSGAPRRLNEAGETHLIAIACSNPPEGYGHWTLNLLKKQLVKDGKAPKDITSVCLWQHLNAHGLKPWREKNVVRTQAHERVH